MSLNAEDLVYIKPEERIYDVAVDKNVIDWKSFLYELSIRRVLIHGILICRFLQRSILSL
jgi:hypothetical protein